MDKSISKKTAKKHINSKKVVFRLCKQSLATILLCICCGLYRFFFANGGWVRQIKLLRGVQTIHIGYGFGPSFKLVGSSHFGPLTFMELQMVTLNSG